jgi:pyruvate-formate lyase-activating enzyme
MGAKMSLAEKIKTASPPPQCSHCKWLKKNAYHYVNKKLRRIIINGFAPCNFSCHHCANLQWTKCTYNAWDIFLDRFGVIEDSGLVTKDCLVTLGIGEYTIARNHGAVLKRLEKYPLMLFTNAYKWSDPSAEALTRGNTWLRVSVDSGTRETFAKVKGVDGWDKVCGNLERYAKLGTIILKYIIFPGQNDDDANFKGFYELADRLGAKTELSRDYFGDGDLPEETLEKMAEFIIHFQNSGKLYGVDCLPDARARLRALLQSKGAPGVAHWE